MERTSLAAQMAKNLPVMQETSVQSLGQGDLLEKEMGTPSSILAWEIPWTEEPGRLHSMGSQKSQTIEVILQNTMNVLCATECHLKMVIGFYIFVFYQLPY